MNTPLKGIKVIDLSSHGAVPSCGKVLSDWGADVTKVEPASGDAARFSGNNFGVPVSDEMNPHFEFLNGGKKSIVINLKTEKGQEIINRMLETADILITNYRQPALVKLKLDYETLSEKYPGLIWAHLTGFGSEGPAATQAGFDTVAYYARTGALLDFAEKDTAPINAPFGVGDLTTGSVLAGAVCAALFNRTRNGRGEKVDISLYGQSIWSLGIVLQSVKHGSVYPRTRKEATIPLNNCYCCKDGKWIYVSVLEYDRYCNKLFRLIGREELCEDERYNNRESVKSNNVELIKILDEGFRLYSRDKWDELLTEADIAHNDINDLKDVLDDEQALANDFIINYRFPNGEESVIAQTPVRFGNNRTNAHIPAPALSENAAEVLTSLGYTDDEIKELAEEGITII